MTPPGHDFRELGLNEESVSGDSPRLERRCLDPYVTKLVRHLLAEPRRHLRGHDDQGIVHVDHDESEIARAFVNIEQARTYFTLDEAHLGKKLLWFRRQRAEPSNGR